ncbi:hypothetical protein ILUMI_19110 [Ignelater luminosus]|uniref:HTH psq-type domain-containing protein n=1 Tax=Ignelater luminosus TaxID=2038154 RepID=A0A8K0CGS3_IGNLU|nr:hypothetical protein ILUMI_19110 [Ignelater luminosus]
MPKTKKPSLYRKTYTEANITHALDAINHEMSKRKAAAVFNIPRSTLQFRLSQNFVKSKHRPNSVLCVAEENTLVDWILENALHYKKCIGRTADINDTVVVENLETSKDTISYDEFCNIVGTKTLNTFDIEIEQSNDIYKIWKFFQKDKNIAERVSNNISQTQEMKNKTDDNENSQEHKSYDYLRNICDLDLTENSSENLQKDIVATYNIEDIPIVIVPPNVQLNDCSYNDSLTAEDLQILSDCEEIENISLNVELNYSNENKLIADYGDISSECKKNKDNKLLTQKEKKPRKGISKVNVISNVILPTTENSLRSEKTEQPEKQVRRLFEDDSNISSVVTQKSETNGILQSLSNSCFVNSGLCYMCVQNITSVNVGLKCKVCRIRQYHKICLQKVKQFPKEFVCNPCLKKQ